MLSRQFCLYFSEIKLFLDNERTNKAHYIEIIKYLYKVTLGSTSRLHTELTYVKTSHLTLIPLVER